MGEDLLFDELARLGFPALAAGLAVAYGLVSLARAILQLWQAARAGSPGGGSE